MLAGFDPLHYLPSLDLSQAPATTATATPGPDPIKALPPDVQSGLDALSGGLFAKTSGGSAPSFWSFLWQLFTKPTDALKGFGLLVLLVIFGILFVVGGAYILVKDGGE
jgi:hypothetical protein